MKRPLYQNITFHRVVPHDMIQAGDPTGLGTHNCGFTIRDEFLPGLRFDRAGRLAMANTGNPDSGGCQFFITSNVDVAVERQVHDFRSGGRGAGRGREDRRASACATRSRSRR